MTTVILIRHGETDWNLEGRFRGNASVPLNARGLREAELTAHHVAASWRVDAIYSSPIVRALQTAQPLGDLTGMRVEVSPGFTDLHFGVWEGHTASEVALSHPEMLETWMREPASLRIPEGETLAEVEARATHALSGIVLRHRGQTVAVVSHTGVNRLVILKALRASPNALWHVGQDTCAVNILRAEHGAIDVLSINHRWHLAPLG